jgi:hypothetical protein
MDSLAIHGINLGFGQWWITLLDFVHCFLVRDLVGLSNFRFSLIFQWVLVWSPHLMVWDLVGFILIQLFKQTHLLNWKRRQFHSFLLLSLVIVFDFLFTSQYKVFSHFSYLHSLSPSHNTCIINYNKKQNQYQSFIAFKTYLFSSLCILYSEGCIKQQQY